MRHIRFIADVNIEKSVIDFLIDAGYDVKWIPEYNCGICDDELLQMALKEKRILITNDKDFGELVFLQKKASSGIILFRIKGQKVEYKVNLMKKLLLNFSDKLIKYFVIITEKKLRFMPMEDIDEN